jgi:mono/diheme cytochrome c family protein
VIVWPRRIHARRADLSIATAQEASMSRIVLCRIVAVILASVLAVAGVAWAQAPWVAPEAEKAKKNPLPNDKKVIEQGQNVAKTNCVTCHGPKGKGDGPAAVALNPKPADWTSKRVQDETDGELFWKISNGRGAMPPWKHLPENDRWAVVRFIRSLK